MSLQRRLLLPLVAAFVVTLAYFYGIWLPELQTREIERHRDEASRHIDSVAEGLTPLLMSSRLDVIYENLDALRAKNGDWIEIRLNGADGTPLYPLGGGSAASRPEQRSLEVVRQVGGDGRVYGTLTVVVDQEPMLAYQRRHSLSLGIVFLAMSALLVAVTVLVVRSAVLRPVRDLVRASEALARRDFDVPLPPATRDEIGALVSAFAAMRESRRIAEDSMARSNRELEQFAYAVSHDLRQPLRMVASYVSLLERRYKGALDAEADEFIHYAMDGARRMDRMIVDLLEYSRVGRKARDRDEVVVAEVVDESLRMLSPRIEDVAAVVETGDGLRGLPPVPAYRDELLRLFLNVLDNGLKYVARGVTPKVEVDGRLDGDEVVVTVSDNGIGIDPKFFTRIFEVFQRLHSREVYDGSGVGLATCKKIVDHHGGRIWVESDVDSGSTFFIALPRRPA
ncbi:ATP-binding protein [Magnetospirillum sp. UT-4]|uniref:sensor histidine kinase n=1 Tax=Magnetospirillum sp. UT-4 TaxID=2681467 RepID=UPI0013836D58|nr:ATP-binding protein [Magnetospirillum sp. UT-4]CAA7616926.1 putative Histidine kinase [Magnetospirillum sp. UT-4]